MIVTFSESGSPDRRERDSINLFPLINIDTSHEAQVGASKILGAMNQKILKSLYGQYFRSITRIFTINVYRITGNFHNLEYVQPMEGIGVQMFTFPSLTLICSSWAD